MSVKFAGIELKNQIVAASSPLTESLDRIRCCGLAGFGAVILKSAADYVRTGRGHGRKVVFCEGEDGFYADSSFEREILTLSEGLQLYREACRQEDILIIPSVGANSLDAEEWLPICRAFEEAGAPLLQLDFFYLGQIAQEDGFYGKLGGLLRTLKGELSCLVMPKLNPGFAPGKICALLKECGIRQVSLLDSMRETPVPSQGLQEGTTSYFGRRQFPETLRYLREAKRYGLEACAGGGVASREDVRQLLEEGAGVVQVASYVLSKGFASLGDLLDIEKESSGCAEIFRQSPWCGRKIGGEGGCEACGACRGLYCYVPAPVDTSHVELSEEILELSGLLAKNVHEVWAAGRIREGWAYGPVRDDRKKETPCLAPYELLSEAEKQYDRNTALETLKLIQKLGYRIEKE